MGEVGGGEGRRGCAASGEGRVWRGGRGGAVTGGGGQVFKPSFLDSCLLGFVGPFLKEQDRKSSIQFNSSFTL